MNEKKVTVSVFLNKRLKPVFLHEKKAYPIYVRVVYDRNNTQFPINLKGFFEDRAYKKIGGQIIGENDRYATESQFDQIEKGLYTSSLESDFRVPAIVVITRRIEDIVRFEIQKFKERFSLKGLGSRVDFFFQGAIDVMDQNLTEDLISFLSQSEYWEFAKPLKRSEPFYRNYDHVCDPILNGFFKLPDDFYIKIEAFFLLAAAGDKYRDLNSVYFWHLNDGKKQFESFLSENRLLFNENELLKLPLRNFFARYVSLNPPSKSISYYSSYVERFVNQLVRSNYEKMLS